jgi:AbrB family looped-hinge helix DNA binding protein
MLATLTSKGQITIPKSVREEMGVTAGDRLEFIEIGQGRFELVAATKDVTSLKGVLGKPRKVVTIDEMNEAIAKMGRGK